MFYTVVRRTRLYREILWGSRARRKFRAVLHSLGTPERLNQLELLHLFPNWFKQNSFFKISFLSLKYVYVCIINYKNCNLILQCGVSFVSNRWRFEFIIYKNMFAFKIFHRSYPHKYPSDFFGYDNYVST